MFLVASIRVDKNADGRIGEEEVKEVSNKHWLCLDFFFFLRMLGLGVGGRAVRAVSVPFSLALFGFASWGL
jgi:hypothetical protein